jgi:hypothetical protein
MMQLLIQLAQTTLPEKASMASRVIWASIGGVAVLIVAGMVLVYLRKKTLEAQQEREATGSLMETLREMHRRGEISDAEYEQTRKSMASRLSHVMDTKRAGGLFELPDPKRRISRRDMGPIAPAPEPRSDGFGPAPAPPARPPNQSDSPPDDAPPGYEDEGGSAKQSGPSP